ncbi:response regulator [Arenibaculum pallidiluteum]|uniref:response regulator n=1 Tax=Arenibaculum pallidiluteum TaxID=2812559 RepID=UPI001A97078A|nr:response regulator [Arenibaculum pallidiluteum]
MELVRSEAGGVLIVEDESMIAMLLEMILEDASIPVSGVANAAEEALSVAAAVRPAAAVIDIRLGPGPDGIHVAERLRERHVCGIVFVSGSGEQETLERISRVEGAVFLQKPVNPAALVQHVRTMLPG